MLKVWKHTKDERKALSPQNSNDMSKLLRLKTESNKSADHDLPSSPIKNIFRLNLN